MNDKTHKTGISAKKIELRNQIIDLLRDDKSGDNITTKKNRAARKLGITRRWLQMVLNLTPHWSHEKMKREQHDHKLSLGEVPMARKK